MTRLNLINMRPEYEVLGSWWVIGLLSILLLIELTVDKVPAVDTANDMIQTLVAAGGRSAAFRL